MYDMDESAAYIWVYMLRSHRYPWLYIYIGFSFLLGRQTTWQAAEW